MLRVPLERLAACSRVPVRVLPDAELFPYLARYTADLIASSQRAAAPPPDVFAN